MPPPRLYTNADLPGEIPSLGFTPPEYAPSTEEILGSWGYPKYGDPPPTLPTSAPTQEENDIAGVAPSIAPAPPEPSQSPSYPPWEPPTPSAPSTPPRFPPWQPPSSTATPRTYSEGPDIHQQNAPPVRAVSVAQPSWFDRGIAKADQITRMGPLGFVHPSVMGQRPKKTHGTQSMMWDVIETLRGGAPPAALGALAAMYGIPMPTETIPPGSSKLPASEEVAGPPAAMISQPAVEEAGPPTSSIIQGPPRLPMRAVRLPNGKLVFTNTADYQGEEMSPAAAGDIVRGQNQGMLGGSPPPPLSEYASPANEPKFRSYPAMDSTGETMRGLVLAAARASMAKDRPVQTAVSQIQTPPGQIPESALQDALRAMALAESQDVIRTARMSPEARTRALSPAVQAPAATFDLGRPIIERIRAQQASDLLGASKNPNKAVKDAEIERINTKANQDITDILMLLKSSGISSAWGPGGVYGQ